MYFIKQDFEKLIKKLIIRFNFLKLINKFKINKFTKINIHNEIYY